nr:immunoglobulin heavy chain junction region [Mus musculus]
CASYGYDGNWYFDVW